MLDSELEAMMKEREQFIGSESSMDEDASDIDSSGQPDAPYLSAPSGDLWEGSLSPGEVCCLNRFSNFIGF